MSAHYAVIITDAAHQNAANVALALLLGDDPALSSNCAQPAVPLAGSADAEATHFYCGLPRTTAQVAVLQDLLTNFPTASWPVSGVDGAVSLVAAQAAVAALFIFVGTAETYTTPLAAATLSAALAAQALQKQVFED